MPTRALCLFYSHYFIHLFISALLSDAIAFLFLAFSFSPLSSVFYFLIHFFLKFINFSFDLLLILLDFCELELISITKFSNLTTFFNNDAIILLLSPSTLFSTSIYSLFSSLFFFLHHFCNFDTHLYSCHSYFYLLICFPIAL